MHENSLHLSQWRMQCAAYVQPKKAKTAKGGKRGSAGGKAAAAKAAAAKASAKAAAAAAARDVAADDDDADEDGEGKEVRRACSSVV